MSDSGRPLAAEPWQDVRVFVQARMSSRRFPGKVLAPFRNVPIVRHVLAAADVAFAGAVSVVLLTSNAPSDDPLAAYVASCGFPVYRGALDDVLARFIGALEWHPCRWVVRLCADSPLVRPAVIRATVERSRDEGCDLVTTVWPHRTFPKGQNVEVVRADALVALARQQAPAEDREHVTRWFYRHPSAVRICPVTSDDPAMADRSTAVDDLADLAVLEAMSDEDLRALGWDAAVQTQLGC